MAALPVVRGGGQGLGRRQRAQHLRREGAVGGAGQDPGTEGMRHGEAGMPGDHRFDIGDRIGLIAVQLDGGGLQAAQGILVGVADGVAKAVGGHRRCLPAPGMPGCDRDRAFGPAADSRPMVHVRRIGIGNHIRDLGLGRRPFGNSRNTRLHLRYRSSHARTNPTEKGLGAGAPAGGGGRGRAPQRLRRDLDRRADRRHRPVEERLLLPFQGQERPGEGPAGPLHRE